MGRSDSDSDRHRSRRRRRSQSISSSSDSSSSADRSRSPHRRHRRRRSASPHDDKSHESHRKHKKEKKEKKDKKEKKSKHKKEKKHKSHKSSRSSTASLTNQYGARGIISQSDMYTKEAEFRAWLVDVKNISIEALDARATREYFAEFAEDYNTVTLPHEKYYSLSAWESMQYRAGGSNAAHGDDEDGIDFSKDEDRIKKSVKSGASMSLMSINPQYTRDQLSDLQRVQGERIKADRLRKMGFKPSDNMGIRYE